jgi:prepilin-type N-terminal cleavage/methylation domain-containing protein
MRYSRRQHAGFSLMELIVVISLILIATSVVVLSFVRAATSSRVNSAVQLTINQLRMARQEAMDRRMQYRVTFTAPQTILIERIVGGVPTVERTSTLPGAVQFVALAGLPPAGKTPDNFGTGVNAIDFDQATGGAGTIISFYPDGTAQDAVGNPNDGVIYIAQPGALYTSHAISLWGATGRLKVWYLSKDSGGNPKWN